MLYDTLRLKLYFTLFWDYSRNSFKYEDYMSKAIKYQSNPIYCILITIAIILLSIYTQSFPSLKSCLLPNTSNPLWHL